MYEEERLRASRARSERVRACRARCDKGKLEFQEEEQHRRSPLPHTDENAEERISVLMAGAC